jgi:transposase-like protein
VGPKHFQNKARREWWSIHIEAWQRSGLSQRAYCRRHRLDQGTFARWLKALAGEEAARKLAEYQTELRCEKRREEREKGLRKTLRQRFAISTDVRHRGLQAFWAMHIEAMYWSGMGVREYAAALSLSPYALRKWRDRLDNGEVEIDWRAHLHPSARPVVSTSAKELSSESSLTGAANNVAQAPATPIRRFFSDERKLAIVKETEQSGVTVSGIARKHGIVTGLLFRWRVEFGVVQKKRAKLASVTLADDTPATPLLRQPEGTTAVDLADGRRAFAPAGSDPDVVRARVESGEITPC